MWGFPSIASLINPRGRQAGRSPWDPSLGLSSGIQHHGSRGSNCSAVVLRKMLAEELWECYEGRQGTRGLVNVAGGKKKKLKGKAVCFSAVFPKTSVNTDASLLTAVSGDGELPNSEKEHPHPSCGVYIRVWFPSWAGPWATLLLPWSITRVLSHELLGLSASASKPQPAQRLGKTKQNQATCFPLLGPRVHCPQNGFTR